MATTTPNFGWSVPTSSDLVKNGATAIETLGDSIDASLVDLKGGTTGQVLAKATDTDMDFTWATPSGGSSNTAGKNGVLNSNFSIWQRGTSFTGGSTSNYSSDRWVAYTTGGAISTFSRQVTNDTTNLPFIQYCSRVQRNAAATSTVDIWLYQSVESANSIPYAGKTVVLSFYARAGANYSAASSALSVKLATGTGTDQNFGAGFTGNAYAINTSATLTTTWQRFSFSVTLASTITELATAFHFAGVGTAGANDYFEITGVQLEIASSVSAYSPNTSTYQAELAACQRYYQRITAGQSFYRFSYGGNVSATQAGFVVPFRTSMRTIPTFTASGNFDSVEGTTSRGTNAPTLSSDGSNTESAFLFTVIASGAAAATIQLRSLSNVNTYIDFSAEL